MTLDTLGHYWRVGRRSKCLTGYMHDAVEDGWWPHRLAWPALDAVTRRRTETYTGYIMRLAENRTAVRVKLADLEDNLSRNGGPHESLRKRYEGARRRLLTISALQNREPSND